MEATRRRRSKEGSCADAAEFLFLLSTDHYCQGGYPSRQPYFEANQECQPPCRVLNSECGPDFKCRCRTGYHPTYLPAPILSSRPPTLVFCQSLADFILNNQGRDRNSTKGLEMAPEHNGTMIVPKSYFPGMFFASGHSHIQYLS